MLNTSLFLDQMFGVSIVLDSLHLTCDKAQGLLLHALIACFDSLAETIEGVIFVKGLCNDGEGGILVSVAKRPWSYRSFIMCGRLAFIASDNLRLAQ